MFSLPSKMIAFLEFPFFRSSTARQAQDCPSNEGTELRSQEELKLENDLKRLRGEVFSDVHEAARLMCDRLYK